MSEDFYRVISDFEICDFDKIEETGEDLIKWYTSIIEGDENYVVFLDRATYNLALLLEKETNKKMIDTYNKKFLTVSSLYSQIINNPGFFLGDIKILICSFLRNNYCNREKSYVYDNIIKELKFQKRDKEIESVRRRLQLFSIADYAKVMPTKSDQYPVSDSLYFKIKTTNYLTEALFGSDYSKSLNRCMPKNQYRLYSLNESRVMLKKGYLNPWSYCEQISKEEFNKININDYKEYLYHNLKEYINVKLLKKNNKIYGFSTIRIVESEDEENYYVIPEVLFPCIDEKESLKIIKNISNRISYQDSQILEKLFDSYTKQGFNEMISFIMNQAVLNEFNSKNNINVIESYKEEQISRISRNYNFDNYQNSKNRITNFINNPVIKNVDEMSSILFNSITDQRTILLDNNYSIKNDNSKKVLEDFFINQVGCSYNLCAKNIDSYIKSKYNKSEYSWHDFDKIKYNLNLIGKGLDRLPSMDELKPYIQICDFILLKRLINKIHNNEINDLISYLLLMNDLDIISLTSQLQNLFPVGISKFITIKESASSLLPLRVMDKYFSGSILCSVEQAYHLLSSYGIKFDDVLEYYCSLYIPEIDKSKQKELLKYYYSFYSMLEIYILENEVFHPHLIVFDEYRYIFPFFEMYESTEKMQKTRTKRSDYNWTDLIMKIRDDINDEMVNAHQKNESLSNTDIKQLTKKLMKKYN